MDPPSSRPEQSKPITMRRPSEAAKSLEMSEANQEHATSSMPSPNTNKIEKPRFLEYTRNIDNRGCLSALEITEEAGFEAKRVFWLHELNGSDRGGHAHIDTEQVAILLQGQMEIKVEHGGLHYSYQLNNSTRPLYLPKLAWVEMVNISPESIMIIASSTKYDKSRSIRSYKDYQAYKESHESD